LQHANLDEKYAFLFDFCARMRDKISILGMIAGGFLISGDRTTIVIQAAEKSDCKFPSNWKSSPVDIINVGKVGSPRM